MRITIRKNKDKISMTALISIFATICSFAQTPNRKAMQYYNTGLSCIKQSQKVSEKYRIYNLLELAYTNFNKAIRANPNFAEAYFQRSRVQIGNFGRLDDLNKAIELKPDFAEAYIYRAEIVKNEEYQSAIEDINKAIELKPKNIDFVLKRAETHLVEYEFVEAVADCQLALEFFPSAKPINPTVAKIYSLLGDIYQEGQNPRAALMYYTNAIRYNPADGKLYERRGKLLEKLGDAKSSKNDLLKGKSLAMKATRKNYDENEPFFFDRELIFIIESRKSALNKPENLESNYYAIFNSESCQSGGYSVKQFGEDKFAADTVNILFNSSSLFHKYSRLIEFSPQRDKGYAGRGEQFFYLLRSDIKYLDNIISDYSLAIITTDRFDYFNNRGIGYAMKNEYAKAIEDFNQAIKLNEQCGYSLYNRGLVLLNSNEYEKAILDFTKVIKLGFAPYKSRAKAYRASGKVKEAEADEALIEK